MDHTTKIMLTVKVCMLHIMTNFRILSSFALQVKYVIAVLIQQHIFSGVNL